MRRGRIVTLKAITNSLEDEQTAVKETSSNNLRYLTLITTTTSGAKMFGIPEKTNLDNEYNIIANNNKDEISFLFNYIEADESNCQKRKTRLIV